MSKPMTRTTSFRALLAVASIFFFTLVTSAAESSKPAHIVIMIGEDEYKTWETVPAFAKSDLEPRGYRVIIIQADAADNNNFPGLVQALRDADLLFVSVRRRTPYKEQLDAIRAWLNAGKPLVGIRTTCHAFALRPKDKLTDPKLAAWQEFDPEVLGGHYVGHHGNKIKSVITAAPGAESHPILKDVAVAKLVGNGSLYKVNPLEADAKPLLFGTIPDKPAEPVAWTRLYGAKQARIFFTSLGHVNDFQNPEFRRFLVNGVAWALGK